MHMHTPQLLCHRSLDEVGVEQWLDVSNEDESSCRSHLFLEEADVVECGKLAVDEFRLKRAHGSDAEFVIG